MPAASRGLAQVEESPDLIVRTYALVDELTLAQLADETTWKFYTGLTDMDAITLSTAQMIKAERLTIETGWRMILVGGMSNLVFKVFAVAFLGNRFLLKRIALVFGLSLVGGVLILTFWP